MDSVTTELGKKIRALRLSRHMTQAQLAGECVTRNMLSLIENGNATPSLPTLVTLADRLCVPVGYFFAKDEEEGSQFLKIGLIGEIRALYSAERYTECLQKCAPLSRQDDEIRMICAECYLALAAQSCYDGKLATASGYLDKANDAARRCVYLPLSIRSTTDYISLLISSVSQAEIPAALENPSHYTDSRIPGEMFAYIAALRLFAAGRSKDGEQFAASPLIYSYVYRSFLTALDMIANGMPDKASILLRQLLATPSLGFFTRYHLLGAMESCARGMEDYKNAYQYSTEKLRLFELFAK